MQTEPSNTDKNGVYAHLDNKLHYALALAKWEGRAHLDVLLKKPMTVLLGEHHVLQRQHRQRAQGEDFRATYRQHRPMVERSIAWLTRGARRVPYRGVDKNNSWLHHRAAALNLRRLLAMGLTHQNGTETHDHDDRTRSRGTGP